MRAHAWAALALVAATAAGPGGAAAAVRIPGTALRFGMTPAALDSGFRAAPVAGDTALAVRAGGLRFFGVPARASLSFRAGRLVAAEFAADSVSPAARSYIEDELTRQGYRRRCARWEPGTHICDWSGRTEMHLELLGNAVKARAREVEPPAAAGGAPAAAEPAIPPPPGATAPPPSPPPPAPAPVSAPHPAAPSAALPDPILDSTAVVLDSCVAVRPEAARRQGIFGRVRVLAEVDTAGRVVRARVVRGVKGLDEAALECAQRYRFRPVAVGDRRIRFTAPLEIRFTR